jgi:hypothetical protein
MSDLDRDDRVRELLRSPRPAAQVDPARVARVREAVHGVWLRETRGSSVRWWWLSAGAAAALLAGVVLNRQPPAPSLGTAEEVEVVAAAVAFARGDIRVGQGNSDRPAQVRQSIAVGETVTTRDGLGTITRLDGVAVRLDRDTRIALVPGPDAFAAVTVERGAVYIDTSAREAAVPLEVIALGAVLQDLGTRYEVRVIGGAVRVRVRDGRVQATRGAERHEATPGSQLLVTEAGMQLSRAPVFGGDWDWITLAASPPQVQGRTLAEFLAWVEAESGRRIRFSDPAIERSAPTTVVYGVIDGLEVDEALAVVLSTCGLAHRIEGGIIAIVADDPPGAR